MAVTVSIDKLISSKMIKELQNTLVARRICTEDTGSQITKKGDMVTFVGLADPTVKTYTGVIEYEDLADSGVTLIVDQSKYVAFNIDDIEAFRSSIDLKGGQVERSAYLLRDESDKYVLNLSKDTSIKTVIDANTSGNEISEDNALYYIAEVGQALDEKNIPSGQRFMVISPMVKAQLVKSGVKFGVNEGMKGFEGGLEFADYLGIKMFVSNNVPVVSDVHYCLAGSYNAIVYASQITKSRFIPEAENSFCGKYSALHVYGAKIRQAKELVVLKAKKAS